MKATQDSRVCYAIAIIAPIIGGIGLFLTLKNDDPKLARNCLLISFAYVFILLAIGINDINSNSHPSTESISSTISTPEEQAVHFVQKYRGSDGKGNSVVEVVSSIVNLNYAGENISSNPSSRIGWTGLVHYDPNYNNVWEVDFDLTTYRENTKIVFYANMDTHTIYPGDATAKNILDIVNMPSSSVTNSTLSKIHPT